MGRPLYTNNAATYLAYGITNTATTMQVSPNTGHLFPNPVGGDYFYVSLISLSGPIIEIVKCTARSGDVFTIERGQEGTTPLYWNMGDNVQLRITAAGMNFISGASATTTLEETQTATQGQTLFTLSTIDYTPNTNNLAVFVNGSKQVSGVNFTETSLNTVTFTSGLNAGDVVEFIYGLTVASGTLYATDIKYNPGFVGGVLTTVENKLQQYLSVKDFGAIGDGVADDTVAIQNALIQACALGGKTVFMPAGIYNITQTIYCGPNTSIVGEGTWDGVDGTSTLRGTIITSQVDGIYFFNALAQSDMPIPIPSTGTSWPSNANANSAHSFLIHNLSIYGKLTTQRGVVIGSTIPVTQVDLQNMTIRDCLIGVELNACYGIFIDGVDVRSSGYPANSKGFQIGTPGSMTSGSINNCFIYACESGIYLQPNFYPGFSINNIDIDGCYRGVVIGQGLTGDNIDAPSLFNNIGFENTIENDFYIRINTGNIGINGYLQASGPGTIGPCIQMDSIGSSNLYLTNGRIGIPAQSPSTSISTGNNVNVYFTNWPDTGTVSIPNMYKSVFAKTGTWTPGLSATGGGSFTYSPAPTGTYTKFGNLVYITGVIQLATNSGTGNISITGLPFAASDTAQISSFNYGRITLDANYTTLGGQVSGSSILVEEVGSGSTVTNKQITASQLQGTAYIAFSGIYATSA